MNNTEDRLCYLVAPKNNAGKREMKYVLRSEENVYRVSLNRIENDALFSLYSQFNKQFDIIIDDYEYERMPARCVSKAIIMTQEFALTHKNDIVSKATNILLDVFSVALKSKGCVEFWF